MEKYETLLIDIDGTLLDFKASEAYALPKVFAEFGLPYTTSVATVYQAINHELWQGYEQGTVPRETVLTDRFQRTFAHFSKEVSGGQVDEQFRAYLAEQPIVLPGVATYLPQLAEHYQLAIVSNGVGRTQRARLQAANLATYFPAVFVSDEVGVQKPNPAFFTRVLEELQVERSNCLVIGDSLTADIAGGNHSALATCWYNPLGSTNKTEYTPSFSVASWEELAGLLL